MKTARHKQKKKKKKKKKKEKFPFSSASVASENQPLHLKADLHGTILSYATSLPHAYNTF